MRAAVITHHFPHDNAEPAIARVCGLASELGAELVFERADAERHQIAAGGAVSVVDDLVAARPDVAIVIGGDGSILRSLRIFAGSDVPTFGFNFGTIGFLTTVEREQLQEGVRQALSGAFEILDLPALRMSYGELDMIAVNDVSFNRSRDARVAEISYSIGGEPVGRVRCDGVVAATPAGSTGYNLANNGPILAWGVEGYVVSFIAPHTLTARALVAAPGDVLEVTNAGRLDELEILIDGLMVGTLPVGERARIAFADDVAKLAQMPGTNFYHRFREKFGKLAN